MSLLAAVGGLTLLLSTVAKLGALLQVRVNRSGTSGWSWGREALLAGDLVVALSGVLGVALSGLLLWQAARYRMEAK